MGGNWVTLVVDDYLICRASDCSARMATYELIAATIVGTFLVRFGCNQT